MKWYASALVIALGLSGCSDSMATPRLDDAGVGGIDFGVDFGGLSDSGLTLDFEVPTPSGGQLPDLGTPAMCAEPSGCDPRDQDACGDGLACRVGPDGASTCVTEGLGRELSACGSGDDCAGGLSCFLTGQSASCARPCCDQQDCNEDEWCAEGTLANVEPQPGYGRCRPFSMCGLAASGGSIGDDCARGLACYIVASDRVTDCRPEGLAVTGEPCAEQNDCAAGFFCAGFGRDRSCVRICALRAIDPCPRLEGTCQAYAQTPEGTGLCTVETARRR